MVDRISIERIIAPGPAKKKAAGFSLVELMVGLTIGFIALAVIVQSLSVFGSHARTTAAGADAQENGLLGLMAIENDLRKAAVGFNHPDVLSCRNFFSFYQETSGTGTPVAVGEFPTLPVLVTDTGSRGDKISIQSGMRIEGAAPALVTKTEILEGGLEIYLRRAYDLRGEPAATEGPPASLVMLANPETGHCALMRITSTEYGATTNQDKVIKVTAKNGPPGKRDEYNASIDFMTENDWPGFGSRAAEGFFQGSLAFLVGDVAQGGLRSIEYSLDTNDSLHTLTTVNGASVEGTTIANDIVALRAQYGISATPGDKEVTAWVNPAGAIWGNAALKADTAAAIQNRQRIKAVRIAVVARSGQRDGAAVTQACTDNNATNHGPCAWTDDTASNPAPAIDLRAGDDDTEWRHYRYRVYQTVIPMRNLMWPNLGS